MAIENIITVAIGIAISIISITIYFLNKFSCFLFLDAGIDGPVFNSAADINATTETATSNLETATIYVTPDVGEKTKYSRSSVSPRISISSPVLARMIPLSPVITPALEQVEIIAQTCTTDSHVTLCVNKPANGTHNNITKKPVKKNSVTRRTNNNIKPKVFTSRKTPIPCAPRRSNLYANSAVLSLSNKTSRNKSVKKPPAAVAGTENNTKPVNKYFDAEGNGTKPKMLTSRKRPISCSPRPTSNCKQAKLVKKPCVVVSGTDNNNIKSVNKYVNAEWNFTKAKILTSRKPPIRYAPISSNIQLKTSRPTAAQSLSTETNRTKVTPTADQAKPLKKARVIHGRFIIVDM